MRDLQPRFGSSFSVEGLVRTLGHRGLIHETRLVAGRVRVREIDDDEGRRLVRIVRRGGRPPKFTLPQRREIKKIAKTRPPSTACPSRPGASPSWWTSWSPRGSTRPEGLWHRAPQDMISRQPLRGRAVGGAGWNAHGTRMEPAVAWSADPVEQGEKGFPCSTVSIARGVARAGATPGVGRHRSAWIIRSSVSSR